MCAALTRDSVRARFFPARGVVFLPFFSRMRPVKMTGQPCCGIELMDARGDHDGSVGDDLYFFGTPGHGIVVSPKSLPT